jgi:hypothetical protein
MTDRLAERLAREAWEAMWKVAGDTPDMEAQERECIAAALRAFQAEAVRVARDHEYYGPGVNDEIADRIEAL